MVPSFWATLCFDTLTSKALLVRTWGYQEKFGASLVTQLQAIVEEVEDRYQEIYAKKRQARKVQSKSISQAQSTQLSPEEEEASTLSATQKYELITRKRDDTLATYVAKREAAKAIQQSALRGLVHATINQSPVPDPSLLLPVSGGVQDAIRMLKAARSRASSIDSLLKQHGTTPEFHKDQSRDKSRDIILEMQLESKALEIVPETQLESEALEIIPKT